MARLIIFSDDMTARVEVITDPEDARISAYCVGCVTGRDPYADNLLHDTHEQWDLNDAIEVAEQHADRCRRCSADCVIQGTHDRSRACAPRTE